MTKSSDCKYDLVKGHASRPYESTGKHLLLINCRVTSSEATRPTLNGPNSTKLITAILTGKRRPIGGDTI